MPTIIECLVMLTTCLLMFGNYYSYDVPSAINKQIQQHLQLDDASFSQQLNLYYSLYSLPNIILPFFGGALIDFTGIHRITLITSSIVVTGQFLFSVGMQVRSQFLIYFGRFLFGVGGETLGISQTTFAALWFGPNSASRSKHLALSMGLNLAVGRLGSVINDFVSPTLALYTFNPNYVKGVEVSDTINSKGVVFACYMGFIMCLVSLLAAAFLVWLDKKYRHKDFSNRNEWIPLDETSANRHETGDVSAEVVPTKMTFLETLKHLSPAYWVTCVIMILSYGTIIPFNAIHSSFLQTRFQMDPVSAAQIMAIPDTISMILTPFTGSFVDRFGHRVHIMFLCGLVLTFIHVTLGLSPGPNVFVPYVPLGLLGIVYAFLLLYWPILTLLVPKEVLSTSYGIAICTLNASLTVFPMLIAWIMSFDPTYFSSQMVFVGCGATSAVLAYVVFKLDRDLHENVLLHSSK